MTAVNEDKDEEDDEEEEGPLPMVGEVTVILQFLTRKLVADGK